MLDMKKANVRKVQHNLKSVLQWVEDGEEVQIVRRNRVVARIVPAGTDEHLLDVPDFLARSREVWRGQSRGRPVSRILLEGRDE